MCTNNANKCDKCKNSHEFVSFVPALLNLILACLEAVKLKGIHNKM